MFKRRKADKAVENRSDEVVAFVRSLVDEDGAISDGDLQRFTAYAAERD